MRQRSLMNSLVTLGALSAPYLIAIPMAIFGVQHFIYLQFVADFIPAWIPWRTFWAMFTGIALIAATVGIVFRILNRWAATLLGTMIFLWVILLHTSRIAARPTDFGEWRGIFQALAMSGCAFVLAGYLTKSHPAQPPARPIARALGSLSECGTALAPYFVGLSMIALGFEHFIFPNVATPQVPLWIPGMALVNYLMGVFLIGCGMGILFARTRRAASTWLGLMLFASMLVIHLPVVFNSPRFESDWTKTLALSGGAFLLAKAAAQRNPRMTEIAQSHAPKSQTVPSF
jgi:uncharacterized membrane protein